MSSMVLPWVEIKEYAAGIGRRQVRPERPKSCPFCDGPKVWFNGWRTVHVIVLVEGSPCRFDDGLELQRVVCASCSTSWTLQPPFLYPHRSFGLDVVEKASTSYLMNPEGTYAAVAAAYSCSPRSVWRWVGWLAKLVSPAAVLAQAEQAQCTGESAALIPRAVPQHHLKAYSFARYAVLLLALQTLYAFNIWLRALAVPAADHSGLRVHLIEKLRIIGEVHLLLRRTQTRSPPRPVAMRGAQTVERPP